MVTFLATFLAAFLAVLEAVFFAFTGAGEGVEISWVGLLFGCSEFADVVSLMKIDGWV